MANAPAEEETGAEIAQKPIELILLREFANRLATPVALYDADRNLVYVNTACEKLFAYRFEDLGETPQATMSALHHPMDAEGRPIPADHLPSGVALIGRQCQHNTIWLHDLDGVPHWCAVTALPLDNQGGGAIGAISIVWEIDDGREPPTPTVP